MRRFACLLPVLLFLLGLGACTNDPIQPEKGVVVTARNLPPTGPGFHYRLWFSYPQQKAVVKNPQFDHEESSYFSAGSFRVSEAGELVGLGGGAARFVVPEGYSASLIADALLTIERDDATDTLPGAVFLAGEFVGSEELGIDTLTLDGKHAFATAIEDIMAPASPHLYILNTPTTPEEGDFAQGIWFAVLENARFQASLQIPPHPINVENPLWTYEAWLVDNRVAASAPGHYISLGRFQSPAVADETGAGPVSGPDAAAAYGTPGEDFIVAPGRVLNSGEYGLMVSLEPLDIVRGRPFVPLLKRDTIPTGLERIQPDSLAAVVDLPMLEVRVER